MSHPDLQKRMGWVGRFYLLFFKPIFFTIHVLEMTTALFFLIVNAKMSTQIHL